jgi:hypothetical protein
MATKATPAGRKKHATGKFRIVATNAAYAKLCKKSLRQLPPGARDRIDLQAFAGPDEVRLPKGRSRATIFISRLADLSEQSTKEAFRTAGKWKQLVFVEQLPVEAVPARLLWLDIRKPERLHVAAERGSESIGSLIHRLLSGLAHSDGPEPIVDAWIEDENIVLLSPSFRRLVVPLEKLAKLIGTDTERAAAFEIDEDGSFLFWPHADVHLGWEQFVQILDPAAAVAAKQQSRAFNKRYGGAIRAVREEHKLKQSEIAGLTERHLRRIEHGEQRASKKTLETLAHAHDLPLEAYLKKIANSMSKAEK